VAVKAIKAGKGTAKMTIDGDITSLTVGTVTGDIVLADNVTVADDGAVTVAAGGEVTVAGTLDVKGMLNLENANSKVVVTGTYIIEGEGENKGKIVIESGGVVWGKGGDIHGTGSTVVQKGAKAYFGDIEDVAYGLYLIGDEELQGDDKGAAINTVPVLMLTGEKSSLSFNDTDYKLTGNAKMYGNPGEGTEVFTVGYTDEGDNHNTTILTLEANSELTIAGEAEGTMRILGVVVGAEANQPGIVGNTGAKIILPNTNSFIDIYLKDSESVSPGKYLTAIEMPSAGHNFYGSQGVKEASNALNNKTYKWNDSAGGNGKPGWVVETGE
jgi:hypothetical protein